MRIEILSLVPDKNGGVDEKPRYVLDRRNEYGASIGTRFDFGVVLFGDIEVLSDDGEGGGYGVRLRSEGGPNGALSFIFCKKRISGVCCRGTLSTGNEVTLWMSMVGDTVTIFDCFDVPGYRMRIRAIEDLSS